MQGSLRDGTPVIVNKGSTTLERVDLANSTKVYNEAWLQQFLFEHPECLPIGEIEPGFGKLVAICKELPTRHGPIDNLFMTGSGDIVMIEAKLWRNSQARRQVIGQALDYASCLFEMSYEEFEAATLSGVPAPKQKSLYEFFGEADVLAEPEFVDTVSRNLSRGRIVVLVVGDGIRSETERLTGALQSHAGFHFTFGLVELAIYHVPTDGGVLVIPRTLMRTVMIERGIVRVDKGQVTIAASTTPITSTGSSGAPLSITGEQFFDAMRERDARLPDHLKAFLAQLEPLGVYPDFQRSLNLRWDQPDGKSINLGYIMRDGQVWTDAVNLHVPDKSLSHTYVTDLAAKWGMDVEREKLKDQNWYVQTKERKVPRAEQLIGKFDAWRTIIENFIQAMRSYYQSKAA